MKKDYIYGGMAIAAIMLFVVFSSVETDPVTGRIVLKGSVPGQYDEFAKCLSDSGAVMYGTDWCPHCKDQKAMFGNSFEFVNFVDCDARRQECLDAGVRGYPTWIIGGEKFEGTRSLGELARASGCELV